MRLMVLLWHLQAQNSAQSQGVRLARPALTRKTSAWFFT